MTAKIEKWIASFLYAIRMELMAIPERPQDMHHYERLSIYVGEVTAFYNAGFKLLVIMQEEFKKQLERLPNQGPYTHMHQRSAEATFHFKRLLYLLSDLVDTRPEDFYAEKPPTHLRTSGNLIKERINTIL